MAEPSVITVPAHLDIADEGRRQWVARVALPAGVPFAGLFAFGRDFAAARKALAGVICDAIVGGVEGAPSEGLAAVRIVALTRKTFPLEELSGGSV